MRTPCPVLVFVAGPQARQRGELIENSLIVGRSPSAGITLIEPSVSREHLRFELTDDGWLMRNLSPSGTVVNSKRYKSTEVQVFPDTGDVIAVGAETVFLFVAAGDDADQALNEYLEAHPLEKVEPTPAEVPAETPADAEPAKTAQLPVTTTLPQDDQEAQKKSKIRKYAIYFGVYLIAIAGLFALLSVMKGNRDDSSGEQAGKFQTESISEIQELMAAALAEVPAKSTIPTRAQSELARGRNLFANLPSKTGDLYQCVKSFKLYLAYKRDQTFEDGQDERDYRAALGELTRLVERKYHDAWAYEKGGDPAGARDRYEELLLIVPEKEKDSAVYQQVVQRIVRRRTSVLQQSRTRRRRRR